MPEELLNNLIKKVRLDLIKSNTIKDLELVRIKFLGKNGYINKKIKKLSSMNLSEKSEFGKTINQIKENIYTLYLERKKNIELKIIEKSLNTEILDITLPGRLSDTGSFHPISSTINRIKLFFHYLGFTEINGPEIEDSYFNFDALNFPSNHPSREQHDTFWFDTQRLLRTHTSGMQIRTMLNQTFPIKVISIGKVYRKDHDRMHTPMFHQIEGFIIDSGINLTNLKKILYDFLYNFFGEKINLRFRPSYFPFTEPSAEIDIMTTQKEKNNNNWVELLGCGMIHPKVLKNVGIDVDNLSGLAFGIGIERLTMLLYRITDIRIFFENDLQFLEQF